jgi:uncharacterized membrane protein YjjP (DUF1212 family)
MNQDIKEKTIFLADYAARLMAVGCQTTRVLSNASIIAQAFGLKMNMILFSRSLSLTLHDEEMQAYTYVKHVPGAGVNFRLNSDLCELAWQALDEHLTLEEVRRRYEQIISRPKSSPWLVLFVAALANACLCRIFGGNLCSMLLVFAATLAGVLLRQRLLHLRLNPLGVFLVCAFASSLIASADFLFLHGGTEDVTLATSVLYLVPGIVLINGVMDLIDHHTLNGIARLVNAMLLVLSIAFGLMLTLAVTGIGQVEIERAAAGNLLTEYLVCAPFAAIAGIGFAIVCNPPKKALWCCGFLALTGFSVRFFLMNALGVDQAGASAAAGLMVGLLSVPISMKIHCPSETFAFTSLLPLIPGMIAYQAVVDLVFILSKSTDAATRFVIEFFQNGTLVSLVIFGMTAGCIAPILLFRARTYSVTRRTAQQTPSKVKAAN